MPSRLGVMIRRPNPRFAADPLTRPRPSGTLSREAREGRGLWLDQGWESNHVTFSPGDPWRERVARSRRIHQPGRTG
jgi:hypothetical protein